MKRPSKRLCRVWRGIKFRCPAPLHRSFTFETLESRWMMAAHQSELLQESPVSELTANVASINGTLEDNSGNSVVEPWISSWLDKHGLPILAHQNGITAEQVILAQRNMFLQATVRTTDVGDRLFELVKGNPETAYFAGSGDASDYLILLMDQLGISAHRLGLWFVQQSNHTAIEYYSNAFGKYVFYDPQFGTHLLDEYGVPAGMHDVQDEISRHGMRPEAWSYQPVRLSVGTPSPADARTQAYESRDYADILRSYLNVVAVRYYDRLPFDEFLPNEPGVRGKWTVYDNTSFVSRLSESRKSEFIDDFFQAYSTEYDGLYHLDFYHTQDIEPLTADAIALNPADSREDLFFQQLQLPDEQSSFRDVVIEWAARYVDTSSNAITSENAPEIIALALYRMFLQADTIDVEGGRSLVELIADGTDNAYWARCGSTSDFMILALDAFGIAARRVNHWFLLNDSHVTIEYYSQADGKFVFYDPMYAVSLVDSNGNRAGVADILHEITRHGFRYEDWSYQAQKIESSADAFNSPAADQRYEVYNSRNYGQILRSYWYLVAVRYEDYLPFEGFLPGSSFVRGKWTVYDNTIHDVRLEDSYKSNMLHNFASMYSDRSGKRYQLSITSLGQVGI